MTTTATAPLLDDDMLDRFDQRTPVDGPVPEPFGSGCHAAERVGHRFIRPADLLDEVPLPQRIRVMPEEHIAAKQR